MDKQQRVCHLCFSVKTANWCLNWEKWNLWVWMYNNEFNLRQRRMSSSGALCGFCLEMCSTHWRVQRIKTKEHINYLPLKIPSIRQFVILTLDNKSENRYKRLRQTSFGLKQENVPKTFSCWIYKYPKPKFTCSWVDACWGDFIISLVDTRRIMSAETHILLPEFERSVSQNNQKILIDLSLNSSMRC